MKNYPYLEVYEDGNYNFRLCLHTNKTNMFISNSMICLVLNVDVGLYNHTLIKKYNGIKLSIDNIVFKKESDCYNAMEWVESILMCKVISK